MWDNTTFFLPLIYDSDQWPTMDVLWQLSSSSASQDSRLKATAERAHSANRYWLHFPVYVLPCLCWLTLSHSFACLLVLLMLGSEHQRTVHLPPLPSPLTRLLASLSLLLLSPTRPWQTLLQGCPWTSSYRVQKLTQMISLVASRYLTRPAHTTCPDSSNPQNYTIQIQILFQFIAPPNRSHPRCHQQLLCAVHHTNCSSARSTHTSMPFRSQKRRSNLFLCPRKTFQW